MNKNLDELVKEIRDILNYYQDNKISREQSGDNLANQMVKLASLNASLGEHVADLEREADIADAHYEWTKESRYKELRNQVEVDDKGKKITIAIGDAEHRAKADAKEDRDLAIEAKYKYRVHQILRTDTANYIDTLRSKLSYMKQERSQI